MKKINDQKKKILAFLDIHFFLLFQSLLIFLNFYIQYSDQYQQMSEYSLTRSFVLENEATQQTQIIKGQIQVISGMAFLNDILSKIGSPEIYRFKIYDFSDNKYHLIKEYLGDMENSDKRYFVPIDILRTQICLLKFVLDSSETASINSGSQSASDTSSVKKERSKERTIAEVIQIVKQWRDIHLNSSSGKKVNLQQSAEMLGISKKSLDDYYYQLRLGQKYDFDFTSHLNQKVGVLRTFIKEIKTSKKDSRIRVQKHPKRLKIIEQFGDLDMKGTKTSSKKSKSKSSKSESNRDDEYFEQEQNEFEFDRMKNQSQASVPQIQQHEAKKQISSIQNQFYNQFEFMGEEPIDPFLNFQFDFKKKNFDDESDQLFF